MTKLGGHNTEKRQQTTTKTRRTTQVRLLSPADSNKPPVHQSPNKQNKMWITARRKNNKTVRGVWKQNQTRTAMVKSKRSTKTEQVKSGSIQQKKNKTWPWKIRRGLWPLGMYKL